MLKLSLHNRSVETVFALLGDKENDMTFSLGWAFSRCDVFTKKFIAEVIPNVKRQTVKEVRLQQDAKQGGYTDIEILGDGFHCIVEAKRGWTLPMKSQLTTYAKRLAKTRLKSSLVVLSECSEEYARLYLPKNIFGIPIVHRSWQEVERIASHTLSHASREEKRWLLELKSYLRNLMNMQDQESNIVFVVALATKTPHWATASTSKILKNRRKYFHPFGGGGWPVIPPNYLGFRYDGKLQSVHHVENYKVVSFTNLPKEIPEIRKHKWERDYIVYTLGKPICPNHEVKTGNIPMNARVSAALDLLLTSKSISEARNMTRNRLRKILIQ